MTSPAAATTTTRYEGLARECSIAGSLNCTNLFKDHVLGSLHCLSGSSDDEVLLVGIRRSISVNLHVGSARLVDGLDRLATFPNNQADFVGSHHDILSFISRAASGPASSASTSSSTGPGVSSP